MRTNIAMLACLLTLAGTAHAQAAASCDRLAKFAIPQAEASVQQVQAGTFQTPQNGLSRIMSQPGMNLAGQTSIAPNPAFCRVSLTLKPSSDSDIHVEVWLPLSGWNGKFLAVGNFGWAGQLMYPGMLIGLEQGYAVASTDTGHQTEGGSFVIGHPEKLIDYAWRADHLMTVDAKRIIRQFYGSAPTESYWIGCSLGGLEALIEAKRYPADYNGIVAGAPPNPIINFNAEQLWNGWLVAHDPSLATPREKFELLHQAVLKACATPIGQKQGFVEEPDKCSFEPTQLLCQGADKPDCLTPNEVRLIEQVYQGPVNPRTHAVIYPGLAKGNEESMSGDGRPFPVALDMFRYGAFQDPTWNWTQMDWDKTIAAATAKIGPLMHVDADLQPFFAHGGKLLMYIGWNDGHNPEQLIGYYKSLMAHTTARTRDSVRLFTIPGMAHCFNGNGCDTFNKLGTIDAWVTNGTVPERIVAAKVAGGQVIRTRPICAWPEVARYKGSGDINDAVNFACVNAG